MSLGWPEQFWKFRSTEHFWRSRFTIAILCYRKAKSYPVMN